MKIEFVPLKEEHFELMHRWLNEKHVVDNWGEPQSFEDVRNKYTRYLSSSYIFPFIVMIDDVKVGFIQKYEAKKVGGNWWKEVPEYTWGIDQFIGEKEFLGKGIGSSFIRQFATELITFDEVKKIIADPHPSNIQAIKAYEKAGFIFIEEISTPDGQAALMEFRSLGTNE